MSCARRGVKWGLTFALNVHKELISSCPGFDITYRKQQTGLYIYRCSPLIVGVGDIGNKKNGRSSTKTGKVRAVLLFTYKQCIGVIFLDSFFSEGSLHLLSFSYLTKRIKKKRRYRFAYNTTSTNNYIACSIHFPFHIVLFLQLTLPEKKKKLLL